jgi:predicted RNA-binding Zn-ribbon protein involved in translation (DUF1610 family)
MKADDEAPENSQRAASVLVRINARAWGVATGALLGVGLFLATLVLLWKGGSDVGAHLGRLSYVLPGYDVSYAGAFLGLIYGFFIGYALGRVLGPKRDLSSTDAANVMLICPKCGERVRVRRHRDEDGHAARQCPECKTVLGR